MPERTKTKLTENRIVLGFGVVAAACLLLGTGWQLTRDNAPTVFIPPPPPLPSPNARDYFLQSAKKIIEGKKVDDAFPFIRRPNPNVKPLSLSEKSALIKANAPALETLRKGLQYEFREPAVRSATYQRSPYTELRELSRLLALESSVRGAQGDWNGAMQSALDIIQIGQELPRGGTLVSMLTGSAMQDIGQTAAAKTIPHLSPKEARAASKRLSEIIAKQVPYADILQEEKYQGQAMLMEVFKKRNWRDEFKSPGNGQNFQSSLRLYNARPATILKNYTDYMDAIIAIARQPYNPSPTPPKPPDDPVSELIIPTFFGAGSTRRQIAARNARLALELVLRAYQKEKGHYPATLNELVPAYLEKLPDNPEDTQGTFGYKRDKDGQFTLFTLSGVIPVAQMGIL